MWVFRYTVFWKTKDSVRTATWNCVDFDTEQSAMRFARAQKPLSPIRPYIIKWVDFDKFATSDSQTAHPSQKDYYKIIKVR